MRCSAEIMTDCRREARRSPPRSGFPRSGLQRLSALHGWLSAHMGTHMKTTIDIADSLLDAAKATAERERTTLRALVEEGLRTVLEQRRTQRRRFRLRDASFKGKGLQPGVDLGDWDRLSELVYEGRGG